MKLNAVKESENPMRILIISLVMTSDKERAQQEPH